MAPVHVVRPWSMVQRSRLSNLQYQITPETRALCLVSPKNHVQFRQNVEEIRLGKE
jgi:hypothetical protein